MKAEDDDDGMPHVFAVYTGPGSGLPPGLLDCGLCGRAVTHREVRAYDADLVAYLCRRCFAHLAAAECWLRDAGLRMPTRGETMGLEDAERRGLSDGLTRRRGGAERLESGFDVEEGGEGVRS